MSIRKLMNLNCFYKKPRECLTLPMALLAASLLLAGPAVATDAPNVGDKFVAPDSPRAVYNFNPGWKFIREDVAGAEAVNFDDSKWADVSLPHTWNETDTYRAFINQGGDRSGEYLGIGWYRKHFKLPDSANGQKIFLEFDGLRQAGHFFLNGQPIGLYENGVTAVGFDITPFAKFGGQDNVLAVQVDNRPTYREEATNTTYEWAGKGFNPNFGGLNRDATLIVVGKIYQTLPLFENLKTTGVYIYPENMDLKKKTTDVTIEAQVRNELSDYASITLSAIVVDADGIVRAKIDGSTSDLVNGESETLTASGTLANARFWDVNDPYLYDVYTILTVNDNVVDVVKTHTGFRQTEFKGGAGTGGVWLNGRFVWLTGYAQRAANDWPGVGGAYPDWMHDFTLALLRASNGNYVRWMHVSPQRADVAACDKYGIVEVCPAGDNEGDARGRQWEQRTEVMRDSMIFYRNNPSILFYEAGNQVVTPEHMQEMVALRQQWDPHGGRVMGTRDNDTPAANNAITPIAEDYEVMVGQDSQTDAVTGDDIFRGYSIARRDRAPLIEAEDFRDEAPRGIWDDFSPPHFGFKPHIVIGPQGPGGNPGAGGDAYHWNSETFAIAGAARYASYVLNRIDNPDPVHSKWSAYASIYFSDSDADGRQGGSEVLRVSGKVDGVRLPKELFFVSRVMQSTTPDLHIIGHWTYPAGTKKTVYVAANLCDQVELFVNGQSKGVQKMPTSYRDPIPGGRTDFSSKDAQNIGYTGYIYAFPDIAFVPGSIKAVATKNGQVVAQQEIKTAGAPASIKLTVHTGPKGLQADGSDDALIDFEVVDADGNRCPTDEARVDFAVDGPVVWRGGFCSDQLDSTNNLYLDTECGINRVAIRSTLTPGTITVTATRDGLKSASVTIDSHAVGFKDGLDTDMPQDFAGPSQPVPNLVP
jgi:beta-galactosidase